ncbi:hypothetical protein CHLRE_03g146207v5 [Chlamydomonas reinhardtii]|uniref:Calcineurin-like phosphoesterase domain-containing protein n=1 Tax=Chlamydomonas reinhardtii TaxID=3055 RepID=A8J2X5_CHLRE|nr:uncharacterized protein CHLRE_03g146207v5 [Chlamydomonas reinhardtii]PNW84505.1 hypothetical protein CHLRE_03g146207v5 [Chlamydomonas reinhardtii]|eukprot:XP_001695709.1 metallophosphoesterase, phosphate-repressible [Chlamydomonas reinhardtii]
MMMQRKSLLLAVAALAALAVCASAGYTRPPPPRRSPPRMAAGPQVYGPPMTNAWLKMPANGRFRILQVADVHYQNGASTGCQDILPEQNPCSDVNSTALLTAMIKKEQPNLVVFTGDNVWYPGNTDIVAAQAALTKPLNDAGVPYMLTFGNHDCESEDCRSQLIDADMKQPYSLTVAGPKELHGKGNYAYTVTGTDGKPAFAVYVMDGGAYLSEFPGSYDFIHPDQVQWYNETSMALEKAAGRKVPGVAFTHIPMPEYDSAFICNLPANTTGISIGTVNDFGAKSKSGMGKALANNCTSGTTFGVFQEGVYSANVNGGLFSAMAMRGDIKMVNVGHDHVNDFCTPFYGIQLCYGGGFGYHAYGKAGWPRRARTIDLYQNGTVHTYKTLDSWGAYAEIDHQSF